MAHFKGAGRRGQGSAPVDMNSVRNVFGPLPKKTTPLVAKNTPPNVIEAHRHDRRRGPFHDLFQPALKREQKAGPGDPPFGEDEEAVVRLWCERAGIPYLGRADIGHDSANKLVPFGLS